MHVVVRRFLSRTVLAFGVCLPDVRTILCLVSLQVLHDVLERQLAGVFATPISQASANRFDVFKTGDVMTAVAFVPDTFFLPRFLSIR